MKAKKRARVVEMQLAYITLEDPNRGGYYTVRCLQEGRKALNAFMRPDRGDDYRIVHVRHRWSEA